MSDGRPGPTLGAVIITMGDRPGELRALLDSVARQDGDPVETVVVGNGAPVGAVPAGVRTVELPENLGIPGGRNVGIEAFGPAGGDVDVLLFLDDDGLLARTDTAELHEETDLAWRALDAGWMIDYRADLVLLHPTLPPSRHAVHHRMVARNRVWPARRNLPAPLVPGYLGVWLLLTVVRRPSAPALRAWFGGFREGWATPCGPRRPMKWRTVWRLTRLGRPPVI